MKGVKICIIIILLIIPSFSFINVKSSVINSNPNQDMIIITNETLKNSNLEYNFQKLKLKHEETKPDFAVEIKTVEEIYSEYSGINNVTKIKNFIRDAYQNFGTEYILLGGDDKQVPVNLVNGIYGTIASDQWYITDEQDNPLPNLCIGRACVQNYIELSNFVEKTINYIDFNEINTYNQILLIGEQLSQDGRYLDSGASYMLELIDESKARGITTNGFPSSNYNFDYLFEWRFDDLFSSSEIIEKINTQDYCIINHIGHSTWKKSMKITNEEIRNLNINKPCFIYSQGCYAGAFDYGNIILKKFKEDCPAESFTVQSNGAVFAGIWNTRLGTSDEFQGTNGPSQIFNREFWDAIFKENIRDIGKALQDSKKDTLQVYPLDPEVKYCYWEITLFGDPAVELKIADEFRPAKPEKPSGAIICNINTEYSYSTATRCPSGEEIYYNFSWGDDGFSGWIGPYQSGEKVNASHIWTKEDTYKIKVQAKDTNEDESLWSDTLTVIIKKNKNREKSYFNLVFYKILKLIFNSFFAF